MPYDIDLVEGITVKSGTTTYNPKPCANQRFWDDLNYSPQTSDAVAWWWVQNGKFAFYPRPATDGNEIAIHGKIRVPDLNVADYTTGTIDIVTNGSHEITGSSTVFTTPMVGRWIRITHSNTATSSGDGQWYEITDRESDTVLRIARPYGGRSLITGAAAAYIIGHMPALPEAFHDLPEIYAAYRYWLKEKDDRAVGFKDMLVDGVSLLFSSYGFNDLSMVLDDGEEDLLVNPNLVVRL